MSLKLFMLLATIVLVAYGDDVERKDNAESYITKEAAKELRNKLSAHRTQQDSDYDEILKKIIMSVQQPNDESPEQIVYEKKYFDYLPNDLDSDDVTDEDSAQESVKSYGDQMSVEHETKTDNVRRLNSRKFKRDLTSDSRQRRQTYRPASSLQSRFSGESQSNVNPWSSQNNPAKFHVPYNFYLPALRPGVNNPDPPHNPSRKPTGEFPNRSIFEEDDSGLRVWDVNSLNPATRPASGPPPQRPPPPPQFQGGQSQSGQSASGSNALDSFDMPNEPVQPEIEYPPPEIFDVPLTTRRPLKKVTITKTKNPSGPNRNVDRGMNSREASTTTTTTTTMRVPTTTRQPIRTASRKPNTSVPNCVLAIVNCCSQYDEIVRTPCFEKYNCAGAFFGRSPCSPDIKAAAFREVEKFTK